MGRERPWLFALFLLALVSFHFALRPLWVSWPVAPDLLVCALLLAARALRVGAASALGFALGLLEDAFAVTHFGTGALVFTAAAALGSWSRDVFLGDEPLFIAAYLFAGKWVVDLAVLLLSGGFSWWAAFVIGPGDALVTSAVGAILAAAARVPR
jgi:cell shape-determining protein MreD